MSIKNIFNLGKYFSFIKKASDAEQIETKLVEKNEDPKKPEEITENQLEEQRKETKDTLIEENLENVRRGSVDTLVEKQLDSSKSNLVDHRNDKTSEGDINKLEEKRLSTKDTFESEKPELSSQTEKDRLFYENKSPDGLKLASITKISQDFEIETPDWEKKERYFSEHPVDVEEKLSRPPSFEDLPIDIIEKLKEFKEEEDIGDLEQDPEFLHSIFEERIIAKKDIGGTDIEEKEVTFDLRNEDGSIIEVFSTNGGLNEEKIKELLLTFLTINNPKSYIDENSIYVEIDRSTLTGKATYIIPVL